MMTVVFEILTLLCMTFQNRRVSYCSSAMLLPLRGRIINAVIGLFHVIVLEPMQAA